MTEPLSNVGLDAWECRMGDAPDDQCALLSIANINRLIASHRLLQQRITALEAERDKAEMRVYELTKEHGEIHMLIRAIEHLQQENEKLERQVAEAVSIAQMVSSFSAEEYPVMVKEALSFLAQRKS